MFKVSDNRRYFVTADNKPFFWLADTAWELIHRLTRDEIRFYLDSRQKQGFNVIQAVVLAELDGLNTPNREGHCPLIENDPAQPNEEYFKLVDFVISEALKRDMTIALLPTWGDKYNLMWGVGPVVFTPENAAIFGQWLARRYRDTSIVWVLGGDREIIQKEHHQIIDAMAKGIRAEVGDSSLITLHPNGRNTCLTYVADRDWLDFAMIQSGHNRNYLDNYVMIGEDYNAKPTRPVIDAEPCYEEHPRMDDPWESFEGFYGDFEVRRAAYWSILSGACGHTYGTHPVWQMYATGREVHNNVRMSWRQALELPGASQMQYVKKLYQEQHLHELTPMRCLVDQAKEPYEFIAVMADSNLDKIVLYNPVAKDIILKDLNFDYTVIRFDPPSGEYHNQNSINAGGNIKISSSLSQDEVIILTAIKDNKNGI